MRHQTIEKLPFLAMFWSLVFILLYLALAVETSSGNSAFWEHPQRAASFVAERAMKGLLLTALLGFVMDWYMKIRDRNK